MSLLSIGIASLLMVTTTTSYTDSIHEWQQQRDKSLRSPDGWLTLVGLFWLKPGNNTIGSAGDNDFVLPRGSAPEHVGTLRLQDGKVTFLKPDGATSTLSYSDEKPETI